MRLHNPARRCLARLGRPAARTTLIACVTVTGVAAALTVAPAAAARGVRSHPAAPVARPVQAAAAPAGKLTPRNCTEGAGTAACDLYAMTGTTSLNGATVPIWGFSTSGAAGTASAPGPQLVVRQGDAVTITLHNTLADNVALSLPGQVGVAAGGAPGDDRTGAAAGQSRAYTFTANRPGTFLYQAGHTLDGDRQVAMGLAGALVVLPADGTAYGTAATAYDDEAVLVLSEVDPALNADPAHFDMRGFRPAYRLINGKPFPATDPVSTDQAHLVLLRYVNAGAETHPMGILGGSQLEIAQDGHRATYPTRLTAESVVPGATVDTLVRMPSGPEAKLAVYDTSQQLDNNGQTTASPVQLAFGGMLTFLDTHAPAPSTDAVGPVPAHVSVSPNPSDGLADATVTADLSDATTGGGNVVQAEFVVDDAVTTGPGYGVPMSGPFGGVSVTGAQGTIPAVPAGGASCAPDPNTLAVPVALSCLDAGKHRIYVRGLDSAGNWGVLGSVVFNLPKTGPATTNGSVDSPANGTSDVALSATGDDSAAGGRITAAEYFVDTLGGKGTGTPLTLNRSATVVSEDAVIPAAAVGALSEGTHHLLVRSKDTLGLWGPELDIPLSVDKTGPTVDAVSIGPDPSNGLVSDKSNPGYAVISGQLTDRDAGGGTQNKVVAAEAFIDSIKAPGSGLQLLAVDGAMDSNQEAVYGLVPLTQLRALTNGEHTVYLRGKDDAGNWGPTEAANLVIDKVTPVLSGLSVSPNPTNGAGTVTATATVADTGLIQSAEYWFGSTDPGVGKATATQPSTPTPGTVVLTIPTSGLPFPSTQTLNIRVRDQAGNWSVKATATLAVSNPGTAPKPNRIFADDFEPGAPAWNATTSGVSNTGAARLATGYEAGSTQGMQATLPSSGTRAAYRTDNAPNAESTYHARFAFNRNTLNVGTSTPVLFRAVRGTSGTAFTVQYRMYRSTPQLRIVLYGNSGSVAGSWHNLAAGANTIQLDWAAGSSGTLALVLNGATVQTLTRANGNVRVDSVRLGLVSGFASRNTGTAYFDSFSSGRQSAA